MKNLILYIHQLPQNIVGLIVILVTEATKNRNGCYESTTYRFGVSLGNYIIFGGYYNSDDVKHEQGHQKQSLYLGWLYLLVVGLPSVCRNIYAIIFHKSNKWYYSGFPEKWADELGRVKR